MKRIVSSLLIFVMCLSLSMPISASAATIKISKAKATMEVDSTLVLKLSGTDDKVAWSTSKKTVASVSSHGEITAKSPGQATVTATVNKKKYSCTVTVVDSNADNAVTAPSPSPTPTPTPTKTVSSDEKQNEKSITVYVTKTGSKYHRSGCRYLNKSKISIDLSSAKSMYTPCSVCNPPK